MTFSRGASLHRDLEGVVHQVLWRCTDNRSRLPAVDVGKLARRSLGAEDRT